MTKKWRGHCRSGRPLWGSTVGPGLVVDRDRLWWPLVKTCPSNTDCCLASRVSATLVPSAVRRGMCGGNTPKSGGHGSAPGRVSGLRTYQGSQSVTRDADLSGQLDFVGGLPAQIQLGSRGSSRIEITLSPRKNCAAHGSDALNRIELIVFLHETDDSQRLCGGQNHYGQARPMSGL